MASMSIIYGHGVLAVYLIRSDNRIDVKQMIRDRVSVSPRDTLGRGSLIAIAVDVGRNMPSFHQYKVS